MKIFYDYKIFLKQSYGGPSRYFLSLAKKLIHLHNSIVICSPFHINRYLNAFKNEFSNQVFGKFIKKKPKFTSRILNFFNHQISNFVFNTSKSDIYHTTYYGNSLVNLSNRPLILTVHDLIHEKYLLTVNKKIAGLDVKKNILFKADHIICVSKNTQNDLLKYYNIDRAKTSVVYPGVKNILFNREKFNTNSKKEKEPYLLYVGTRNEYKNYRNLTEAIAISKNLKKNFKLVFFGGGGLTQGEKNFFHDLGFRHDDISQINGDDNTLMHLYKNASAFIYPSFYEGFGSSPLEAMSYGCPVISSNTSCLPEVQGEASGKFDPNNIEEIANQIESVVFSKDKREKLILLGYKQAQKYTWNNCALQTFEIYKKFKL